MRNNQKTMTLPGVEVVCFENFSNLNRAEMGQSVEVH
jgi:hypothetical protein